MKFIHLSDLHLGKKVNEFSMIEDQKYILTQIIGIAEEERPDAVLIAGDIYDKTAPSAEAVQLCDWFLSALFRRGLQVFVISGNHDSPERIAFGSAMMEAGGLHMSPVYMGEIEPTVLTDEYGEVHIYMLPFVKPANVRGFFPEEEIASYTDAVRTAVANMELREDVRNVLITHQYVTGASRCDSEDIAVGGTDNVDASVFDAFDYVALGHIHGPQDCGTSRIRYCGTPLKYSFSEARDRKSVTVAELKEKGNLLVRTVPLTPRHDMTELKGTYSELTLKSYYDGAAFREDYLHLTLTDEDDVADAVGKLRMIYPNLMKLDYDNTRTRTTQDNVITENLEQFTPFDLFSRFFEMQNNRPMSPEQTEYVKNLMEKGKGSAE